MERIELAVAGLQQSLRPDPPGPEVPAMRGPLDDEPAWLQVARQTVPMLRDALCRETAAWDQAVPRSRRLHAERNHLIARLRDISASLLPGQRRPPAEREQLRCALLRLANDVSHHRQRVTALLYDEAWLDVGGSE